MKFTKEEISLCKQVAEKWRKKIEYGDWFIDFNEVKLKTFSGKGYREEDWLPLWTISDCLEFLEQKGFNHIFSFICYKDGEWTFTAESSVVGNPFKKIRGEKAKTPLEACLRAVLAVLEEGK
ncbi:MAG: hypothetical protein E3J87_07370 [Candidatus Cloacimonadota bacterium]|nr:MAG: hypothetical protein E3J87_07370 [Candidatus Cloacimonadota bacterium]